jgi:[acyl-carrier-protein] S-malonyltransferase
MTLAFTFPGQGSQSLGMLGELAQAEPVVRETFEEASGVLGYDLWRLCQEGPVERLDATEQTQPAMLTAGVAVWRAWCARGGAAPHRVAGHSLGEYAALVCAGALGFAEAVGLVAARGRFMQEAVPVGQGGIAAILGLEDAAVEAACEQARAVLPGRVVSPANYNAPGQVAIAGHLDALERALELAREAGARRAIRLPMSVPVHCELMAPATGRLAERLAGVELANPRVPVLHNADLRSHPEPEAIRAVLTRQLCAPVRWADTVRALREGGARVLVEPGPGRVLSGLARRIDRTLEALPVLDPGTLEAALGGCEEQP